MRLQTGVSEPLIPDFIVSEVHQNNHSYVFELSGPTFWVCAMCI